MALSKPCFEAQIIVNCELCETNSKLHKKCLECDLLMCKICLEKVHAKFLNASEHHFISIKDIGNIENRDRRKNLEFNNIPCKKHPSNKCCFFCTVCDQLVCPSCYKTGHSGHDVIEIQSRHELILKEINSTIKNIEEREKEILSEETNVVKIKSLKIRQYESIVNQIKEKRDTLKTNIDRQADKLIKTLDSRHVDIEATIAGYSLQIKETQSVITSKKEDYKSLLATGSVPDVFDKYKTWNIPTIRPSKQLKLPKLPQFIPNAVETDQGVVGDLYEPGTVEPSNAELKKEINTLKKQDYRITEHFSVYNRQTFTTELSACLDIKRCPDESLWLRGNTTVQNVVQNKDKSTFEAGFSIEVQDLKDFEVVSTDQLLIADMTSNVKMLSKKDGTITNSIFNAESLFVIAVHIVEKDIILLGARSTKYPFPVKGRRVVCVMGKDGQQKMVWEFDPLNNNERLFSDPRYIASSGKDRTLVLDATSERTARIVVMNKHGQIITIYNGHPYMNSDKNPFNPTHIQRSRMGRFYVSDCSNHAVHYLDGNGIFLCFIQRSLLTIGIKFPHCFTYLWKSMNKYLIASKQADNEDEKTKVYKISLYRH